MSIYDKVLASGYYVFRDNLSSDTILYFLKFLSQFGITLNRDDLRTNELKRIIELQENGKFKLKEGFKLEDIKEFLDDNLVYVFMTIKNEVATLKQEEKTKTTK